MTNWTRDPVSGAHLAEASDLRGVAEPRCPLDGSVLRGWTVERRGTALDAEIVAWTGACVAQGHAFRVFND